MKKKLRIILFTILAACIIAFAVWKGRQTNDIEKIYYMSDDCEGKLENLSLITDAMLSGYDSLMIVAHPDDETIWGGSHLLKDNYVVVCITNGNNRTRRKEFSKVMKKTNSIGIMLSYPDKTNGEKDNWNSCRDRIQEALSLILAKKQWNMIVTHNPDGEYGHIHHQMTSEIVTSLSQNTGLTDKLFYFGKYVKEKNMDQEEYAPYLAESLTSRQLKDKLSLTDIYSSQKTVMDHLGHMLPYENWIKADTNTAFPPIRTETSPSAD